MELFEVTEMAALLKRADLIDQRISQIEDREAIYRLLVNLQTAMDERDIVRYGLFYAEDGEWCAVSGRAIGPAAIAEFLRPYCRPWESEQQRSYHSIADVVIDLDGDLATAHGQWRHDFPDEQGQPMAVHFGRFEVVLQRMPEGWRIKRRASFGMLPYIAPIPDNQECSLLTAPAASS